MLAPALLRLTRGGLCEPGKTPMGSTILIPFSSPPNLSYCMSSTYFTVKRTATKVKRTRGEIRIKTRGPDFKSIVLPIMSHSCLSKENNFSQEHRSPLVFKMFDQQAV